MVLSITYEELASKKYRCRLNHELQIQIAPEARYAMQSEVAQGKVIRVLVRRRAHTLCKAKLRQQQQQRKCPSGGRQECDGVSLREGHAAPPRPHTGGPDLRNAAAMGRAKACVRPLPVPLSTCRCAPVSVCRSVCACAPRVLV